MALELYGRASERAAIDRLLAGARRSESGVLVLRAEAGMGKSALLSYARHRAPDLQTLTVVGIEPEMALPYAALHRFLHPALDLLERIPAVQAEALRSALAIAPGRGENRFTIALAVLSLLAEVAAHGPVLCLIDDAQWLDRPSADALSFVARRVQAEGVVLLFAARDGDPERFPGNGLPDRVLRGLAPDAAEQLLVDRFGTGITTAVRAAVRDAAHGNPLALVEIPVALSPDQLAGRRPLPVPMPLGSELERMLLTRVHRLSPDAQSLLLVAAAEGSGDAGLVLAATARLGIPDAALQEAESAGVIRTKGGTLAFRHPILRTAVYQGAGLPARRAAHRALADVLTGERDADRRAWHRAALVLHHDDGVADELEQTAERARRRGGYAAASAALRRAADLSSGAAARYRRLTGAARAAWDAGRPDEAAALVRLVEAPSDPGTYAELSHLQGELELRCGLPAEGAKVLLAGAVRVADVDPHKALQLLLDAALCAIYGGESSTLVEVVRLAQGLPAARLGAEAPLVDVLQAVTGMMLLKSAGAPQRLLRWLDEVAASDDPQALIWAGAAAAGVGDQRRQQALRRRAEVIARRSTAVGTLATVLERIAWTDMMYGQVSAAAMHAREGLELAGEAALINAACFHRAILAWVAALRGDEDGCLALVRHASDIALSHGLAPHQAIALWATGLLRLGQGRWEAAAEHLAEMSRPGTGHPFVTLTALPDLVEAAVRAHQADLAQSAADRFLAHVRDGAPAWQLALAARCRALIGPADEREKLLSGALALHEQDLRPFSRGRTLLVLGEHLRRERRRAEARRHLVKAVEVFDALGAAPWATRARAELGATGETARKRAPHTYAQLTPQQAQIMRMVADGATNKEVAAQLFLSPRTVDYHLRNVFLKLGVSSRGDLIRLGLEHGPDSRRGREPGGGVPDTTQLEG